ncbi:hypothetical protein M9H77_00526 [Catharanthus roseus]|nr:hypothetical protein M9H77_00507 [Catharanthus roseus]KAI5639229.1 hypothetical protein M9H77_00554 [Catharanthus roseus]KAI5639600.1 hypothetical protein M9H77_00526 [Catharanthus roseus]
MKDSKLRKDGTQTQISLLGRKQKYIQCSPLAAWHHLKFRIKRPYLPVREQLFLTIGIDVWREEIKKQRQKPNFVVLKLIEQRESCSSPPVKNFFLNSIQLIMGLVSLTSVLVSGAIPLTPLLLARLHESYGQAPSRGRRLKSSPTAGEREPSLPRNGKYEGKCSSGSYQLKGKTGKVATLKLQRIATGLRRELGTLEGD